VISEREGFGDHGGEAGVDFGPGAIPDDEALLPAGASQLRFDRHDDGIEIRPLARCSGLQGRGDLFPAQPDFDPIGRYGYPLDIVPDEAFPLDGRQGEPSLGKLACVVQGRIERVRIKIERCDWVTDVETRKTPSVGRAPTPRYHPPGRASLFVFAGDLQPEATPRHSSGIAWLSL
jgi:hypothetical protein